MPLRNGAASPEAQTLMQLLQAPPIDMGRARATSYATSFCANHCLTRINGATSYDMSYVACHVTVVCATSHDTSHQCAAAAGLAPDCLIIVYRCTRTSSPHPPLSTPQLKLTPSSSCTRVPVYRCTRLPVYPSTRLPVYPWRHGKARHVISFQDHSLVI
jgi:hypothetical protein